MNKDAIPGPIILFGSGETASTGRKTFQWLFERLKVPVSGVVLETPAGFEPNSAWVAGQVVKFLENRLQNFDPRIEVIPAKKRGTLFSPDNPEILAPMKAAQMIYMGAGSPTYALRQLSESLAWDYLQAAQYTGSALVFASAMTLALSHSTLPVYEIYKVGQDLHWLPGLNFFNNFGLKLSFIPHWNNQEGGQNLDTSRCFMGEDRFNQLYQMLSQDEVVIGIDEHTALIFDFGEEQCLVHGKGGMTLLEPDGTKHFTAGEIIPFLALGGYQQSQLHSVRFSPGLVQEIESAKAGKTQPEQPPADIIDLADRRQKARENQQWQEADVLRNVLAERGWQVTDTAEGPQLKQF